MSWVHSMWRLIFLGLIIWFGIYIFKRNMGQSNTPKTQDSGERTEKTEYMVRCATCAVHLPRSEAFLVDGAFYCSKAHIQSK